MNPKFHKPTNTKKMFVVKSILIIIWSFIGTVCAYEVPEAKIEVFYPIGFDVSIPHEEGITTFLFSGKINNQTELPLLYMYSPVNGRWKIRDRITELKLGDMLLYWVGVYHKERYYIQEKVFFVQEYAAGNEPVPSVGVGKVITTPIPPTLIEEPSCAPSITTVNGITKSCVEEIVFEDEFPGSQLDTKKWKIERRFADEPDNEFVWYLNNIPEVLKVINGTVIIKPIAAIEKFQDPFQHRHNLGRTCTGKLETSECIRQGDAALDVPPFISAQFSTKESFAFKYGRIEIRAKLPNAPWVFPEIWLQPMDSTYSVNDYQLGQMRVAFSRSNGNVIDLFGGVILHKDEPLRSTKMCKMTSLQNIDWGEGFHVYKLLWNENFIAVAVDNEEYCRIRPTSDSDALYNININGKMLPNRNRLSAPSSLLAPFDQEFFITLGYGIGGHTDFADGNSWQEVKPWYNSDPTAMNKLWNQKKQNMQQWLANGDFQIDYVKVFSV